MLFNTFTLKTSPVPASIFSGDRAFSLSKALTIDPTGTMVLEEFVLWAFLTLSILSCYYLHVLLQHRKGAKACEGSNGGG